MRQINIITSSILTLSFFIFSCSNGGDDSAIDKTILSKIDNSLKQDTSYNNKMNGVVILGLAVRLSDEIMRDKFNEFNEIYKENLIDIPKYRPSQWSKEGVIETSFDNDDIPDYLVLTHTFPTPIYEGGYSVIAIRGKDYKMYFLESFSIFKEFKTLFKNFLFPA